jgi:citrate lyase beta subunit
MNAKEIGIALAGTGCAGNMKAGLADYTTAVGAWETAEDPETNFSLFLQTVATVANSYGLHAIGPTPPNVEADTEAWGNMCRKMGYSGIMTIHPKQRDGAIRAFTPKPERIARAIKRLDALEQSGGAAVRLADGSVIEVPMCGPDFTVLKAAARAGLIDASSITRYSKLFQ